MSTIQAFDYSVNLLQALLWQYNDAARLQSLLEEKQAWYDTNQTAFYTDWERDVFDLQTANDFGLSVWAIILDLPLVVQNEPPAEGQEVWGFLSTHKNFNNGNFSGQNGGGQTLNTEQARLALRLRYFEITSRGTVPEINRILGLLFGNGQAYVIDNLDMTMTYVFTFIPSSQLLFVIQNYDLLPRPAGVGATITFDLTDTWGFDNNANFDNGNFGV